ncbi:MAG: DUF4157 domain-containing protein [Tannerellaceae bacterium]|nr:DUF4157 domain-containing protein [Tannerellaceae bacterium]
MREYKKKPKNQSHTLDSNPKASRQAPVDVILQRYKEQNIQRYTSTEEEKPNNTGLPDNLKTGIENLSGYSMDDVKVHYNSDKPAQLQALAYTQGTDIHIAPGQEKHLPHEAWHVVQQKEGRVQPTMQLQGININDNEGLEKEADLLGERAIQREEKPHKFSKIVSYSLTVNPVIQGKWIWHENDRKYHTEELYDGVRWYGTSMDSIYFIIENRDNIKLGIIDDYEKLAGESNARSWDKWNAISVTPFKNLDEVPESDSSQVITFEQTIELIKQGFQHYPTIKAAFQSLGVSAEGKKSYFIKFTINKELAKGNPEVISILLQHSGKQLKREHIRHVMSQYKGMDISDKGQDIETAEVISGYTLSEFEYVTAFTRGSVWSKDSKKLKHATAKERLKGALFFSRMNNVWDNVPTADVPFTWRTEDKDYGEISKGGLNKMYKKSNPASTSVNIIPHRAEKKENMLLKITNLNPNNENLRQPIDVRKYSQYPEEGEILYPAYTMYETNGKIQHSGNYDYIDVNASLPLKSEAKTAVEQDICEKLSNPPIETSVNDQVNRDGYDTLLNDYEKKISQV